MRSMSLRELKKHIKKGEKYFKHKSIEVYIDVYECLVICEKGKYGKEYVIDIDKNNVVKRGEDWL